MVFVGLLMIVLQNVSSFSMASARVKTESCCFAEAKHAFLSSNSEKNDENKFLFDMFLRLICLNMEGKRSARDKYEFIH